MNTIRVAWKMALASLLGAALVWAAPALGGRAEAADDSSVAGLKQARVAFDVTAGEPGRLLNILNTIDETREGLAKQGVGQKVDRAQVNPDVTVVENSWITLVGYQARGYAYIAP
jgi:hypothetical protein